MAINRFWHAEVIYHDEGDRLEKISVHSSGLPHDPEKVSDFLKSHNYGNKNVTIQNVTPVTGDAGTVKDHPFIGQANSNLFNSAGQQVNERHEKVESPATAAETK